MVCSDRFPSSSVESPLPTRPPMPMLTASLSLWTCGGFEIRVITLVPPSGSPGPPRQNTSDLWCPTSPPPSYFSSSNTQI
ncbi:LOB domain-containing protein 37-like [Pyrus ussuriensis x Pyrus communis]|uniref:LOB domain-containing protein 37-like n=1 Tax=Pyrus ussuriensis x Pyrus communis TaxID=2448454 RepID=A0A5N5H1N3_9ROSA|nr:LOB domain-containing protein 37-like [Pyrus ussuriensis x Pyrus communis]